MPEEQKGLREIIIQERIDQTGTCIYEITCPRCDGIIKSSTENPRNPIEECYCERCCEEFKIIKVPKKKKKNFLESAQKLNSIKPGEVKLKKEKPPRSGGAKKLKNIPEGTIQTRRIHEVICPECGEIADDSTGHRRDLVREYICEGCDTKFKIIEPSTKKDGRGKKVDKEVARNNILREVGKSKEPISVRRVRKNLKLNKVLTKGVFDDLEEEGLFEHVSKGWIIVE